MGELRSHSPADPDDELGVFPIPDAAALDAAVLRAREAAPAWRARPLAERAAVLRRVADRARATSEALAELIAREMGKALWEARAEAELLAPKIEVTLGEGLALVADQEAGPGARATHHPRGVLAVLGPFNFPAHLPHGHLAPALVTGNAVVFKPSELAPAVGQWLVRLWHEAGLPEDVLQIVHGGAETGSGLALHPGVDGVLFTGSWRAGRALSEATLDQPHKIVALEMGGKNAIVVMDDADLVRAVADTALSVAATTGQRCTCASRLFVHQRLIDPFCESLARVLTGLRVGPPREPGVFMGPLVSRAAHERLMHAREQSVAAGGERLLDVDPGLPAPYAGAGLVRYPDTRQDHPVQREELFGPEAAIHPIRDLDEAIAAVNDSDYGLAAALYGRRRRDYEHAVGRVRTGLFNWNRPTVGASGRLPFGGLGRSGNDRPAGVAASLYCTAPQAHLEGDPDAPFDPSGLPPGLPAPETPPR